MVLPVSVCVRSVKIVVVDDKVSNSGMSEWTVIIQPDHSVCHSVRPDAVPYLWTLTDDPVLALYQGNVRGERVYLQTIDHNILLILCDGFFGSYSCRRAETICSIVYWKFTLFCEWLPYRHPLYEGTQKHFTTFCFPLSLPHPHSVLLSSLLPSSTL